MDEKTKYNGLFELPDISMSFMHILLQHYLSWSLCDSKEKTYQKAPSSSKLYMRSRMSPSHSYIAVFLYAFAHTCLTHIHMEIQTI